MSATRFALTAIETGATALWVGASAGFAFVSAPIAFRLVTDRDVFAQLTERSLERLAALTYIAGGIATSCALLRAALPRAVAGTGALGAIVYHQRAIVPAMTRAQAAMGGFAESAEDDPQRVAYRALHKRSTRAYGAALLLGIVQLVLAATGPAEAEA